MDASLRMARLREESYQPVAENKAIYDKLFAEYVTLHDYFGRGENDVMKRLKVLKIRYS
jgi:L-ribulokinase